MWKFLFKRFAQSLVILIAVTLVIFTLIHLAPGDPFIQSINPNVTPELREKMLRDIGFFDPIHVQYLKWLSQIVQGNLGYSIKYGKSVVKVISDYLPNTLLLGLISLFISIIIAIPAGIYSATRRNSGFDYFVTIFTFLGLSIPAFFFGLLLVKWFSFDLKWLPTSGMVSAGGAKFGFARLLDIARHMILPAVVLSLLQTATFMRYTRSSMIEVINQDFIRTARAKGVKEKKVIHKHAFRNALLSVITIFSFSIPSVFSGAVLTETIFVWPGIGRINYDAILGRDYPLVMGIMLLMAVIILLSNLLADVLYALADPRIRYD
ncbi:MAG: ABC transporter permease [Anaerolineaceae bacterium]|nr:ABC transporter permease [Anaerolineaceae bacterium]